MINLPADYTVCGKPGIHYNSPANKHKDLWCPYGWYISVDCEYIGNGHCNIDCFYLHSDGNWRPSTLFNGKFTGYYETKEAAEFVLNSAIGDTND